MNIKFYNHGLTFHHVEYWPTNVRVPVPGEGVVLQGTLYLVHRVLFRPMGGQVEIEIEVQ